MSAPVQSSNRSPADPWTIRDVLAWATRDFTGRGLESPRLDAELLLGSVLDLDRVGLIRDATRPLSNEELSQFRELIKRRRRGEPVAYLLGHREFYGLDFRVDPRVLIPRPDTETLVETALEVTQATALSGRHLDLCTGSGCVAIAFAKQRPTWEVTATDVSQEALGVARENALRLGTIHNTSFVLGDLFAAVDAETPFDLVTANPPYISRAEYDSLDAGIRDYEPRLALWGGDDGLDLIRSIARQARRHLSPGGVLAVEIGYDQGPRAESLLADAGFDEVRIRQDYGRRDRVVSGRRR